MTEQEYRKHPAISQSQLGWLDQHPKYYRYKLFNKTKDTDDHFRIGAAVDCLLTNEKDFKKSFYISKGISLTGKLKVFSDSYVKYKLTGLDEQTCMIMAHQDADYSVSLEAAKKSFMEDTVQLYVKERLTSDGKTMLTEEEFTQVKATVRMLKFSDHTKEFFDQKSTKDVLYFYQFPIIFKSEDMDCKGLLDLLIIDHINKVVKPIDLKTTGKYITDFPKSFIQFRYYLQAAYYTEAVRYFIKQSPLLLGVDISDYTIENFSFIVAEKANYSLPYIYKCTDNDLYVGEFGGKHREYPRHFKGFRQLLRDLKWHTENNYWEMPKEAFESNFTFELDVFEKKMD